MRDTAEFDVTAATATDGEDATVTVSDTFPEFALKYPSTVIHGADGAVTYTYEASAVGPSPLASTPTTPPPMWWTA